VASDQRGPSSQGGTPWSNFYPNTRPPSSAHCPASTGWTWLPFSIQICLNGRSWLAQRMDAAGLGYVQRDNCFTWLQDPEQAQQLMNE
jgi:hypothetical protein